MATVHEDLSIAELFRLLEDENCTYQSFLQAAKGSFIKDNPLSFWNGQKKNCGLHNSDIINRADIGYTFFYDIINGRKQPSREKLIRLFLAMKFDLDTCQEALRMYGYSELFPKIKRDSIFIYAVNRGLSINELNELLSDNREPSLK